MINLNCISRIETDDIVDIINEKNTGINKSVLLKIQTNILERYAKFIDVEENKRLVTTLFTDEEINALHSLYDAKTNTAKTIVKEISDVLNPNHSDYCLYCGIGEIDQIDHFLPKEHFPEFSILHKNLIPICGKCNEIKGANIPGVNNRDYLHLIFDTLPIEHYQKCEIKYTNRIPKVTFSILTKFEFSTIGIHYSSLRLSKRIEKKSTQYFLQIKALKKEFGSEYADQEIVRDSLKSKVFFGEYYWKSVLLMEMLNSNFIGNI
jgi:hypothetical protein